MFKIFKIIADKITFDFLGINMSSHFGEAIHFFIEDITKIFFLLFVLIYFISFLRASLDLEAVRDFLKGKNKFFAYFIASIFGAITPFCSCSSIPLFLGFTSARIPLGITMAFLITSPMVNEIAVILLASILGIKFTIIYVSLGIFSGVIGGMILDFLKADKLLKPFLQNVSNKQEIIQSSSNQKLKIKKLSLQERHLFAKIEMKDILKRIYKWVFLGILFGAILHGFVPESFIVENLNEGKFWTVPLAAVLGIPLYSNASAMVPVAESLLLKGLPVGTTLTLMMSTVACSLPEFAMLKQVMETKLLIMFFTILFILFTISGWIFNFIF